MFQKKIFKIWLPMLVGICLCMIPCNGYASETVSKGEVEDENEIELYANEA